MSFSPTVFISQNPFFLAPMAGITDSAFRSFMRERGCGVVTTELVSATGLKFSSEKTKKLMSFTQDQHPIGIQLFGDSIEDLAFAAQEVEQRGADFVELNMGCPVAKVVKKGAGSALLKDLPFLKEVLRGIKRVVSIPVTIKIRTGWDEKTRNSSEVVQLASDEGVAWVSLHGRTRAQGYSGFADWDYIREVKGKSPIPLIGNGDIHTAEQAIDRLKESKCDGVMIGRGCLKNPWIFEEALSLLRGEQEPIFKKDPEKLIDRLTYHLALHHEERIQSLQLKKFAAWYSSGFFGSSQFRRTLFQIKERKELQETVIQYFSSLDLTQQEDTSREDFLMGGHG